MSSATSALVDGSIIVRTLVEWDAATTQHIRFGGKVQIEYALADEVLVWQRWEEGGANTSATIPGLKSGFFYLFRARFVSAPPFGVAGDWCEKLTVVIGQPPPTTEIVPAYTAGPLSTTILSDGASVTAIEGSLIVVYVEAKLATDNSSGSIKRLHGSFNITDGIGTPVRSTNLREFLADGTSVVRPLSLSYVVPAPVAGETYEFKAMLDESTLNELTLTMSDVELRIEHKRH